MGSWKRITLISFILIGSVAFFSYWSINQFNQVFDSLNGSVANILATSSSFKKNTDLASISLEIPRELATPTDETMPVITSTTTTATTTPVTADSTDLEMSFTFPQKGDEVYTGCTYSISWQSSTAINSLETALVDAGTGESMGPIASGLAKENTIEKDLQNLKWKVGNIWPGEYYIKALKINGADVEIRSKAFAINNIPKGLNTAEREKICKKSGASI